MADSTTKDGKSPFTIAIAGGGLAGLALAIGLLKQGINVAVYEQAPAFAEIGAGLGVGPNSRHALQLLDEKLFEAYQANGTENAWEADKNIFFTFRHGQREAHGANADGQKVIARISTDNARLKNIHRAHLLDAMVKLVPAEVVHFHKRLVNVKSPTDHKGVTSGGALLEFEDGSSATADAVVGCDGIRSMTRQILLGTEDEAVHPVFTDKYAYRGVAPMDEAVRVLGEEKARNSQMYLGPDGHLLTFPIEQGKTMNIVAFHTKADGRWDVDDQWIKPVEKESMFHDFEGWNNPVQAILGLIKKHDVWALFDLQPLKTYISGPNDPPIALLGDAAHGSTPHQGAGAGMAFEDAYILSTLLGHLKTRGDAALHIPAVFRAFDAVRRPRTQKLTSTSREAGELYDFRMPGIRDDEEKVRAELQRRFKWIWEENLQRQLEHAEGLMRERGAA